MSRKKAVVQEPGDRHLRSPDDPGVRAAREDDGWSKTKTVAEESPVWAVGGGRWARTGEGNTILAKAAVSLAGSLHAVYN